MILDDNRDTRVEARVNSKIKALAAKKLAAYGLTISNVINIVLTNMVNYGIPSYLEIPNRKVTQDVITSLKHIKRIKDGDKSLPVATMYKEAMRMATKK